MSTENIGNYGEPGLRTFDLGEGMLPMNVAIHSPFIVADWKAQLYLEAVSDALPADISAEEASDLRMGCHWAANRASRYDPYQTSTPYHYNGQSAELSAAESKVLRLLGAEKFMAIHTAPLPEPLIDYILSGGTDPFVRPQLEELTVAVIKGQLAWEDRFTEAGVPQPQELMDKITKGVDEGIALFGGDSRTRLSFWQAVRSVIHKN